MQKGRRLKRLERHKVWVAKLLDSADGGAGLLHHITKPRPWRGGAQVLVDVFEDAHPLKRVEVIRQEWKEHWQVDAPEQVLESGSMWSLANSEKHVVVLPFSEECLE